MSIEEVTYIWGICNILWIIMNMFIVKVRLKPTSDNFIIWCMALIISPLALFCNILQIIEERTNISEFLTKER